MRIAIIAIALILTGCASDPITVAVKTPLPPPPPACIKAPELPPRLPDRDMSTLEMAKAYARLKANYQREVARFRLCQKHVARLGS